MPSPIKLRTDYSPAQLRTFAESADQQARNAREHKADRPALALARAEPGGEHLAIYARQLALQPRLRGTVT